MSERRGGGYLAGRRGIGTLAVGLPAFAFAILVARPARHEYYATTLEIVTATGGATSLVVGWFVGGLAMTRSGRWRFAVLTFVGQFLSWLVALAVWLSLNVTPLCVGRENGDGINHLSDCVGYVILAAVWYPVFLSPWVVGGCLVGLVLFDAAGGRAPEREKRTS